MRRLLLPVVLLTALPFTAQAQVDVQLEETIRCYDAAAVYAQQFVVAGQKDSFAKLNGYASELKSRAYALGAKHGKSKAEVRSEFADNDSDYVRRFYIIGAGGMAATEFARGEIDHCGLNKVLK
jgi:hypothetical protein